MELKTEIKTREIPNQGVREARKKTLIIFFITFPFFSLIIPLTSLVTGVTVEWQRSIAVGLALGMVMGLFTGGQDWIQHLALRLTLWWQKKIPRNYAQFLNYAAERRLLQKTGGRYRFLHDSLRKYFCGNTLLPAHAIEITKNKWLGYVLVFFTVFSISILNNSIYTIDLSRISLLAPTIQIYDITFSDIITYRWRNYQRGDVIELRGNELLVKQDFDKNLRYIMRVVGLPGETWEIKQGQAYLNGQLLSADYLDNLPIEDYDRIKMEVPTNQYLVKGKSVTEEGESIVVTLVSEEDILNRVIFRLFPLKRFGYIK